MKKRFSEDQIHKILKESESGASTPEVCRKYGISANTFYRWRSKYGGMELNDLKRMKSLEEAQRFIEEWRTFYNSERPHSSL
ncbi:hypothetical protein CH371_18615 [Leptospira wolffii]|uniref:Uncharacterized protein n=1 Tax=Leptospira wolffii TaxID=409998 RepID=A0A2M9Z7T4_9LEPT|nr:hypothetical protein CH371_18615 [Leptospira wolffii]